MNGSCRVWHSWYRRAKCSQFWSVVYTPGGGTDLERGMGMCGPEDPLFTPLLLLARVPFQARVSSQDPLWRKFGNFSLYSLNFHPNFSSQAPKFGNFQLTSPQIWKFSAHKPPFSVANVSSQAPHFGNLGRTPLPKKKLSAPPPGFTHVWKCVAVLYIIDKYEYANENPSGESWFWYA